MGGWVPVSFMWLKSSSASDVGVVFVVVIIERSRWSESHVVVTWMSVLSFALWLWLFFGCTEAPLAGLNQGSLDHESS